MFGCIAWARILDDKRKKQDAKSTALLWRATLMIQEPTSCLIKSNRKFLVGEMLSLMSKLQILLCYSSSGFLTSDCWTQHPH